MKNPVRTFILALICAAGSIQAQSPVISFEQLMTQSEENSSLIRQAAELAIANQMPVSVYTPDHVFIQALGVENGRPVYAVIRNLARPYDNGTTNFYEDIKGLFDPATAGSPTRTWALRKANEKSAVLLKNQLCL